MNKLMHIFIKWKKYFVALNDSSLRTSLERRDSSLFSVFVTIHFFESYIRIN